MLIKPYGDQLKAQPPTLAHSHPHDLGRQKKLNLILSKYTPSTTPNSNFKRKNRESRTGKAFIYSTLLKLRNNFLLRQ